MTKARASVLLRSLTALSVVALAGLAARADDDDRSGDSTANKARVATLDIEGALREKPHELSWLFGSGEEHTLRDLIRALHGAADRGDLQAVMIRLKDAELTPTQVEELSEAVALVRKSGKKVHVFSDAYSTADLMLGAHCDEIILQEGGPVMMPGLHMEEMFLADTLAWAGVKADMVQVGDYKGASEQMARSSPSPQWDQNINQLLDSMYANIRRPVMAGRKMDGAALDKAMDAAWLATSDEAKRTGLVDSVIDLPTLSRHMKNELGKDIAWRSDLMSDGAGAMTPDMANPFAMLAKLSQQPDHSPTAPTIAVLHISGPIMDGESSGGGGPLGGGETTGSRTIRNAIEDLRDEELVKGVIVRIDSPGGSATASEIILQGVRRLREIKPVWVSVGGMAASGGYYIAVSGEKIYVNPSSIVGSIGVVGGKMSMEDLYKKLKVNVVGRSRGPRADMFASNSDWTEAQRADVRRKMTQTYELFTQRVREGREGIDLSKTAEGRLFTGDKAIGLRMADKVGGLEVALSDMAESLGLDDYDVMDYPAPRSFEDVIKEAVGGFVQTPGLKGASAQLPGASLLGAAREVLGDKAFVQVEDDLRAFMLLRDNRVLLMSPRALIFR
jgi:protease-4